MSRQFKAYASAYSPRGHESTLRKDERQTYACDFNGALNTGEAITAATIGTNTARVALSGLSVASGVASLTVEAISCGYASLTLEVTTSAARKLIQVFVICVETNSDGPASSLSWSA